MAGPADHWHRSAIALNDLGRESVAVIADFLHPIGYRVGRGNAKFRAK